MIGKYKIDKALVKQFANGDMKAFDSIYSAFNHKLQKFIFSLIKTESDTEDLIHEVFVKVWENRGNMKNHNSFDSYLFTIAYNTTISFLREKAKNTQYIEYVKSVQIGTEEPDFIEEVNSEELNDKINRLIEEMPPRQRDVFKLKYFQDYSYKEIAETLNISVNTVENHIVKAHKYIKENMGKAYLSILLFIHLFL